MEQPILLLIKGHPGVGKSTLARQLCQQLKWPLIDKDDARDCLETLPAGVLQPFSANQLSYDIMFQYCRTQLSLGLSVVVDCPLARVELYDEAERIAQQHSAVVAVVDCVTRDEQLWQQRLESRAQEEASTLACHKPQTWSQMQQLLHRYNGCWRWSTDGSRQLQHHLVLDTSMSLQHNAQAVLQLVESIRQQAVAQHAPPDLTQQQPAEA